MKFKVYFKTSNGFGKNSIPGFNNYKCLQSLLQSFSKEEIFINLDNGTEEQKNYFLENSFNFAETQLGNCSVVRHQLNLALNSDADIFYFVEHDHFHLNKQKEYLCDGLSLFDIVSLYDHPDKYSISVYPDLCAKLYMGKLCHWRNTPSTVVTFACKKETLYKIKDIIFDDRFTGPHLRATEDHSMFLEMWKNNISIGTPIPGRSTHLELSDISPYVDWISLK